MLSSSAGPCGTILGTISMQRSEHQQSLIDVEHDQLIDMETNIAMEAPWPSQFDNTSPLKTVIFHS